MIALRADEELSGTATYVRQLWRMPWWASYWRRTIVLHAVNELVGGFGVEALGEHNGRAPSSPPFEYINMGDTYAATLVYETETDELSIGSWGDVVEALAAAVLGGTA